MKYYISFFAALFLLTACKKDTEETTTTTIDKDAPVALAFENREYSKKSSLPCTEPCTYVSISIPEAEGGTDAAADSINNKVFNVVRNIVYFGEKPTNAKDYDDLMASFIKSYDDLKREFPEDAMSWEAKIKGTVDYKSDSLINIKLNNYMFTGGAHGYEGNRSLLFNRTTGKSLQRSDIFKDEKAFTALAEKKFRQKYKVPAGKSINATGLFFENDTFALPESIFFKEEGLLLFYNSAEIGSFADGQKEILISYTEAAPYLKVK